MKIALLLAWLVGVIVYLVDALQRAAGYVGWRPSPMDAIAIVAIAASLAVIWRMDTRH